MDSRLLDSINTMLKRQSLVKCLASVVNWAYSCLTHNSVGAQLLMVVRDIRSWWVFFRLRPSCHQTWGWHKRWCHLLVMVLTEVYTAQFSLNAMKGRQLCTPVKGRDVLRNIIRNDDRRSAARQCRFWRGYCSDSSELSWEWVELSPFLNHTNTDKIICRTPGGYAEERKALLRE